MTLQEAETELSKIDSKITELLKEREIVLKEWTAAFNTKNQENIICVDERIGDCHILYLINGESKMEMCRFSDWELKHSVKEFYRMTDNMVKMTNIANGREYELPVNQKHIVYAKITEIRGKMGAGNYGIMIYMSGRIDLDKKSRSIRMN